jgi:hypothetical protein
LCGVRTTPGGINVRLRSINSYLTWLHEEGHTSERLRVRLLPKPARVLVTFSDAEVSKDHRYVFTTDTGHE